MNTICKKVYIRSRTLLFCIFSLLFCIHGYCQDCTLAGYLEQGVANSPLLKDMEGQILSNQYDSLVKRAAVLPQVNFNGYLMYAPAINGWGYSTVITNGQNMTGTITASQQIFNKKTREANLEKYGLESGSLKNARKISLNELKKAITAQYLASYAALEERRFQQDIHATLMNESAILKAWTEKGIYRKTDFLSLQVEIHNLERNIRDLDVQYRSEFWNLNLICGLSDTALCDLKLPDIKNAVAVTEDKSIFFIKYTIDSLLIRNEQLLTDRRYKPVLSWFADAGLVNNEPRDLYRNFGFSGGLSMTLPVFDGNQRKINTDKIRVREEIRKSYLENFRFRYYSQLKQFQSELEKTSISWDENEKQVALIRELINDDKILLSRGELSVTDYILALKNLIEARHAGLLYKIRTQYILNEINFWKQ